MTVFVEIFQFLGTPCCSTLVAFGNLFPNGEYRLVEDLYNGRPYYQKDEKNFCIFFGRHWKVDGCDFIERSEDWSQGLIWTKKRNECPGDVGSHWRYYSWDEEEGSDSGPINATIQVRCKTGIL